MCSSSVLVFAAFLASQEPNDQMSSHCISAVQRALQGANAAAKVTVLAAGEKTVRLQIDEAVMGSFPDELTVPVRTFIKRDLEPGSAFLVFFNGHKPTGQYELVFESKVRQYPVDDYVARVKYEGRKMPKAKTLAPKQEQAKEPVAPVSAAKRPSAVAS
jgi:hypothetical protein